MSASAPTSLKVLGKIVVHRKVYCYDRSYPTSLWWKGDSNVADVNFVDRMLVWVTSKRDVVVPLALFTITWLPEIKQI